MNSLLIWISFTLSLPATAQLNQAPIADASADITVNYNLQTCSTSEDAITLKGTHSSDPDGAIVAYHWIGLGTISNPDSAITPITNLSPGISYEFILTVTDNKGATDTDAVMAAVVSMMNRP